ncbi:S1/P1 Nuclease [Rhodoferax sp. OV413]|uniref:S1/P1 nuclease n=1 Tax=Rhodoferax sp. OV413 TaxID=1855285 RepID=UPI00087F04AB|nr:S1/P1 nuclease [Rhodoferax sp. OV413]SDP92937.1 S1/P1 Nuclease [Rhodoferax sp. OV413]
MKVYLAFVGRPGSFRVSARLRILDPMSPILKMLTRTLFTGAAMVLTTLSVAHAWGTEGHQVIALIAQSQLSPKAKAEVDRLLAQESGDTLPSISTWADEHRNPSTAPWHYINFPRGDCVYVEQRDCPDGRCVVGAIKKQLEILGSRAPDNSKLTALKYLVHFVGDVHQPLHAGYQDDKGGNKYQLQAFLKGSNLHAVWDSGLIKNLSEEPEAMAVRLQKLTAGMPLENLNGVNAAEESCTIVSQQGFYPERLVELPYIQRYTPVVERRLAVAGARLADVLNATFK